MVTYNKLVRDKIPRIIEAEGKACSYRVLDPNEYTLELRRKFLEELHELDDARSLDEIMNELADLLEVLFSFGELHGISASAIEEARLRKKELRGGFSRRIFLESVE